MNYSTLSKAQKRCVDAFIAEKPELKSQASITRTEVEELWAKTYANREKGGPKFGYPMWLIKGPKVSRGEYVWVGPNSPAYVTKSVDNPVTAKENEDFLNELREAGIKV